MNTDSITLVGGVGQGPIPGYFSPKQRFGAGVENWFLHELGRRGFTARPISDWWSAADLVIDNLPAPVMVEVKGARPTLCRNGSGQRVYRWQFDIARLKPIDYLVAMVVIDSQGEYWPYLVPSWALWDKTHAAVTSHPSVYRGRFLAYLDNWQVIHMVAAQRRRHLPAGQLSLWGW